MGGVWFYNRGIESGRSIPINERLQTACLVILATVAVGAALAWLKPVLVPFVLAIFFTYFLTPLIDVQVRYFKFRRTVATFTALGVGCVVLAIVMVLVSATVTEMASNTEIYKTQIRAFLEDITERVPWESIGMEPEQFAGNVMSNFQNAVGSMLAGTIGAIVNILSNFFLVVIFVIFLMLGKTATEAAPSAVWQKVDASIKNYILLKVAISVITGVLHGLVLMLLGVEFAVFFGFLAIVFNFIPNIGPVLATFLPLPVLPLSPEMTWTTATLAIAIPGAIQFISGNVVEPRIMGDSLDLHPVVVLISLIFLGMIWGVMGMFLATPIAAVLRILLNQFEASRPFAELMSGRLDTFRSGGG